MSSEESPRNSQVPHSLETYLLNSQDIRAVSREKIVGHNSLIRAGIGKIRTQKCPRTGALDSRRTVTFGGLFKINTLRNCASGGQCFASWTLLRSMYNIQVALYCVGINLGIKFHAILR